MVVLTSNYTTRTFLRRTVRTSGMYLGDSVSGYPHFKPSNLLIPMRFILSGLSDFLIIHSLYMCCPLLCGIFRIFCSLWLDIETLSVLLQIICLYKARSYIQFRNSYRNFMEFGVKLFYVTEKRYCFLITTILENQNLKLLST